MTQDSERFLDLALRPKVMKAALKISLIVGTILVMINHGNAILNLDIQTERLIQIGLTYLVPYCVSTYSAVKAIQNH